jgi:hypothetical protein
MLTKKLTVQLTETKNLGNFNSQKFGFELEIELEHSDNLEKVKTEAMEKLKGFVAEEKKKIELEKGASK